MKQTIKMIKRLIRNTIDIWHQLTYNPCETCPYRKEKCWKVEDLPAYLPCEYPEDK